MITYLAGLSVYPKAGQALGRWRGESPGAVVTARPSQPSKVLRCRAKPRAWDRSWGHGVGRRGGPTLLRKPGPDLKLADCALSPGPRKSAGDTEGVGKAGWKRIGATTKKNELIPFLSSVWEADPRRAFQLVLSWLCWAPRE